MDEYLRWRSTMDTNKELFKTLMVMLKLCTFHIDHKTKRIRAQPIEMFSEFLLDHEESGVTSHILSFLGEKRGRGDLREMGAQNLWEIGLQIILDSNQRSERLHSR